MQDQITGSLLPALKHAAFATLPDRAFLQITGIDATRWLNGMVTNSVQALEPGEGAYNFLLNAQGRIQGDGFLYRETSAATSPEFLLATTATQQEAITAHLDRFIIMDDVELTPAHVDEHSLLLVGPEVPALLGTLGLPSPAPLHLAHASSPHGAVLLLTPDAGASPHVELRCSAAVVETLKQQLTDAGVPELAPSDLEALRVLEARPAFGQDIRDRDLPQETAQTQALHFAKGCYVGQEIVERIRSRGQVHRQFTAFRLHGPAPDSLPAPLTAEGKPAGELTSIAILPCGDEALVLALGYARREFLETRTPLAYAGGTASVRPPGGTGSR